MTIPNHITLDDLPTMPVGEIAALPGDQLALLKQDADERLRAAKNLCDWLDGAIVLNWRCTSSSWPASGWATRPRSGSGRHRSGCWSIARESPPALSGKLSPTLKLR